MSGAKWTLPQLWIICNSFFQRRFQRQISRVREISLGKFYKFLLPSGGNLGIFYILYAVHHGTRSRLAHAHNIVLHLINWLKPEPLFIIYIFYYVPHHFIRYVYTGISLRPNRWPIYFLYWNFINYFYLWDASKEYPGIACSWTFNSYQVCV